MSAAPTPIKNVSDVCDRLNTELAGREAELLEGAPQVTADDPFQLIGETTTLAENKDELDHALDASGIDSEMVGCQEANAFLTGFANTHRRRHLPRAAAWKRAHERTLLARLDTGVVARQLAGIGVKVDPVYRSVLQPKVTDASSGEMTA